MLQRIQTVHLLVVVALMVVMLFPNYATVTMGSALPAGVTETVGADSSITRVTVPAGVHEEMTFSLLGGIRLNGEPVPMKDCGWYVDRAISTVPLPPLRAGENRENMRCTLSSRR